jgi:hypothetical protein
MKTMANLVEGKDDNVVYMVKYHFARLRIPYSFAYVSMAVLLVG